MPFWRVLHDEIIRERNEIIVVADNVDDAHDKADAFMSGESTGDDCIVVDSDSKTTDQGAFEAHEMMRMDHQLSIGKISIDDSVDVPDPRNDDCAWSHAFTGTVKDFKEDGNIILVIVEDQEENCFDIPIVDLLEQLALKD
jgi:hypothetical protein